jgi:hypothetical protein
VVSIERGQRIASAPSDGGSAEAQKPAEALVHGVHYIAGDDADEL